MVNVFLRIGKILLALASALIILFVGLYALSLWQSYIMEVIEHSIGI